MATITSTVPVPTYTLDLTEEEALYVLDALRKVMPARSQFGDDSTDPVFGALSDELINHADCFGNHARLI